MSASQEMPAPPTAVAAAAAEAAEEKTLVPNDEEGGQVDDDATVTCESDEEEVTKNRKRAADANDDGDGASVRKRVLSNPERIADELWCTIVEKTSLENLRKATADLLAQMNMKSDGSVGVAVYTDAVAKAMERVRSSKEWSKLVQDFNSDLDRGKREKALQSLVKLWFRDDTLEFRAAPTSCYVIEVFRDGKRMCTVGPAGTVRRNGAIVGQLIGDLNLWPNPPQTPEDD